MADDGYMTDAGPSPGNDMRSSPGGGGTEGGGTEGGPADTTSASRPEAGDERRERLRAFGVAIGVRHEHQIVDASIFFQDVDVERHEHAVELRVDARVQRLAVVERHGRFFLEIALREANEK